MTENSKYNMSLRLKNALPVSILSMTRVERLLTTAYLLERNSVPLLFFNEGVIKWLGPALPGYIPVPPIRSCQILTKL